MRSSLRRAVSPGAPSCGSERPARSRPVPGRCARKCGRGGGCSCPAAGGPGRPRGSCGQPRLEKSSPVSFFFFFVLSFFFIFFFFFANEWGLGSPREGTKKAAGVLPGGKPFSSPFPRSRRGRAAGRPPPPRTSPAPHGTAKALPKRVLPGMGG